MCSRSGTGITTWNVDLSAPLLPAHRMIPSDQTSEGRPIFTAPCFTAWGARCSCWLVERSCLLAPQEPCSWWCPQRIHGWCWWCCWQSWSGSSRFCSASSEELSASWLCQSRSTSIAASPRGSCRAGATDTVEGKKINTRQFISYHLILPELPYYSWHMQF